MIDLAIAVIPIILLLFVSEYLWSKKIIRGETARKTVHIFGGVWVAFWPYIIPIGWVQVIGVLATVAILVVGHLNIFKSLVDIKRQSYGEVMYPIGVVVAATLATEPWIFTTAILFVAIADGLAGLIGKKYGKSSQYNQFFGNTKSVVGTLTHFFSAMLIIAFVAWQDPSNVINQHSFIAYIGLPFLTTVFENFAPYGLDNLLSPLLVVLVLNGL